MSRFFMVQCVYYLTVYVAMYASKSKSVSYVRVTGLFIVAVLQRYHSRYEEMSYICHWPHVGNIMCKNNNDRLDILYFLIATFQTLQHTTKCYYFIINLLSMPCMPIDFRGGDQ